MMYVVVSLALVALPQVVPEVRHNAFSPARSVLLGRCGASADACMRERAFSNWARGSMYEECTAAFRTHADDKTAGWQNEYWGKTMLCFAGAIDYLNDRDLRQWTLDRAHEFVREFQRPDGYISTYSDEDFIFGDGFNIWGRKYTLWALIELHRVTGDRVCLDAAVKLADNLVAQLKRLGTTLDKTGVWHGISSMSILKPILELYRLTGRRPYMELARQVVKAMDDPGRKEGALVANAFRSEPVWKWFPKPCYWAKAYEMLSCLEGLVEYHRLTGDQRSLDAVLAFHGHLMREELNPMCSVGYFDHFVNAARHVNGMTELCDVVHWIRLNRELLLLTGETKYADIMEEAFYNAFLAGVLHNGRWGAHIIRSHGTRHLSAPAQTGMTEHQCCPDNMMRTYFDVAGSVAAVDADGTPVVILYSDADVRLPGIDIAIRGGYPWSDDAVRVTVTRRSPGVVRLRVPRWSRSFAVNGAPAVIKDGWAMVKTAAGTSAFELGFDLSPRIEDWTAPSIENLPPSPQGFSDTDIGRYTVFFFEWMTPEMKGLHRTNSAARVLRGPLVLAKGRVAGTSREETLCAPSWRGRGAKALLTPRPDGRTWTLTVSAGGDSSDVLVSDFATVSSRDDPKDWFSLWF